MYNEEFRIVYNEEFRNVYNEEFHKVYSSPNIVTVIECSGVRRVERMALMVKTRELQVHFVSACQQSGHNSVHS